MAITKIQTGGIPALAVTHDKLHTTMDLTGKTVTLPSIDMGSNNITTTGKILFANIYAQVADLPSASTYHGMFAHVHATGKAYYAHAGAWIVLANDTDKLNLSGGTMTGNLTINTAGSSLPRLSLVHSNSGFDNFTLGAGVPGVSNSGFSIRDTDASANRLVISSTGNVGIGTDSPANRLHVDYSVSASSANLAESKSVATIAYHPLRNASNYGMYFGNTSVSTGYVQVTDGSSTGKMLINPYGGNVGIGATDPGGSTLYLQDTHTTAVTNASTLINNTTLTINGNSSQGSDVMRVGPMAAVGAYFIDVSNSGGSAAYPLLLNPISGGKVGIGTTAVDSLLHIKGASTNGGNGLAKFQHTSTHSYVPGSFIGVGRSLDLISSSNSNADTSGIRFTNPAGSRETFAGVVQTGGQGDFVVQGYNGSAYQENFRISSGGQVTAPKQPAFSASGFSSHRYMNVWHNVDLHSWRVVSQSAANAFNNSNGTFTAPVAGFYWVIYTCMFTNPSTNDFHNLIAKNGTVQVYSNNHSGGGGAQGHSWNDTTVQWGGMLAAGDYLTCRSTGSSSSTCFLYGTGSALYSNFSGFLIG